MKPPRTGSRMSGCAWPAVPASVESALQAVREEGGRSTTTRRIVLEALVEVGDGGITAEELADRIRADHPHFTASTIYRCLERFEELGVTAHSHFGHGPAVWRLVDRPRWYLVCDSCGIAMEADPAVMDSLGRDLLETSGFRMDGHFAITGRCRGCGLRATGSPEHP